MYEELLAVLSILGIGGLVATCLTYVFDKRRRIKFSEQEEKEKRYKSLVQKMRIIVEPEDMKYVKEHRPDLKTVEDWRKEIQQEWFNSMLFASDKVIRALKEFILKPNGMTYAATILAMRQDLWNKKTDLKPQECTIHTRE